jgi:hypothetical protein
MKKNQLLIASGVSLLGLVLSALPAQASVRIGIGFGFGFPCYRPWGPYYYPYYYPYYSYPAVYVQPAPIYVPAPVAVAPPPASPQPIYRAASSPATNESTSEALPQPRRLTDVDQHLAQLASSDEQTRADTVMQLGRMKAVQAVNSLTVTLARDNSPVVREAAARALGLIGSTAALPALQQAARTDPEHDVRHSARFAIDVIQASR